MEIVGSAVAGAGKGLLGTGLKEVTRFFAGLTGSAVVRKLAGSTPVTALIFALVEQAWLTWRYSRGRIDMRRYVLGSVRNGGSTAGAVLGSIVMAAALSVFPIVGTVVGLMIGSFLGSIVLGYALMGIVALCWQPDGLTAPTATAAR